MRKIVMILGNAAQQESARLETSFAHIIVFISYNNLLIFPAQKFSFVEFKPHSLVSRVVC